MSVLNAAARKGMRLTVWARLLVLAEIALTVKRHFDLLEPDDRSELQRLVRKSKGKPSNLTKAERQRVSTIVGKLEPSGLAKEAALAAAAWRKPKVK